jgi:S1-C subfamily serine protease
MGRADKLWHLSFLQEVQTLTAVQVLLIGSFMLALAGAANGQETEDLKKGVVKITATENGITKTGTGFIVRLDKDRAYIVTAAHVIAGDQEPRVAFFPRATQFVKARVLGIEGGREHGLPALVISRGVPADARPLCVETETQVSEGGSVMVIGFPGTAGTPWMVSIGTLGGRRGSTFTFSGIIGEGNSGGPVLVKERVVGVITEMRDQIGYAVPMVTATFALEGWGVKLPPGRNV